ncbi:MAG: bifunctional ornithine acetyltransferase/N-acetylglutamate synthase, partial [Candidatus Omnitrophica bacterium]|nr:bifunctional ornithine acetyltransferase/N-acetylglutamate synthase [Candidatus Omnitrophota bacterium]
KVNKNEILVSSTGIIGKRLPVVKIKSAMPDLINKLSPAGINRAAEAIMTTDTFPKKVTAQVRLGSKVITICGIAKGAGMISPDMATLLVFILTDMGMGHNLLKASLKKAVDSSFNCITVDGCMSTNDSVILLANGRSKDSRFTDKKGIKLFNSALNAVCLELAKMVVRDAEGASKFIEIRVSGGKDSCQAKSAALAIANSNLFKTAIYGENPNFGRIAAAVGASRADFKEKELKIKVSSLKKKNILVNVLLGSGKGSAVVYSSDLTPEYIRINAEYN